MWAALCCALGKEPWLNEPRYATHALRAEHSAEINLLVAETLLSRSTQTWVETFERFDVLCAEVQNYAQFREHPQTRHMGFFGELQQQPYGTLAVPYLPGTNSVAPLPPAPVAGQHTREILRQFGHTESEIVAMEKAGVVIQEA